MGIIDASLTRYVNNHPEFRPVPAIERAPIMTLDQFCEANQIRAREFNKPGYDLLMTVCDRSYPTRSDLWHLTDYVVTSVEGGTIWLAPRKAI